MEKKGAKPLFLVCKRAVENGSEKFYSVTDCSDIFCLQHQEILPTQYPQEVTTHMLLNWAPREIETQWLAPKASAERRGAFLWHIKRSLMYNLWQVEPTGDRRPPAGNETDGEHIPGILSENTVKGPCRSTQVHGYSFITLWVKSSGCHGFAINAEMTHRNLNLISYTTDK